MSVPKVVIPIAGKGSRLGIDTPKPLVPILGKPLIKHVMEFWEPYGEPVFIVGHRREEVVKALPKEAQIIVQEEQRSLGDAILKAEPLIKDNFIVALGDCIFTGAFTDIRYPGIGVCHIGEELEKSYAVQVMRIGPYVRKVIEKPWCGLGAYFFTPEILWYIKRIEQVLPPQDVDLTGVLDLWMEGQKVLFSCPLEGKYVNVNYPEDIIRAERLLLDGKA